MVRQAQIGILEVQRHYLSIWMITPHNGEGLHPDLREFRSMQESFQTTRVLVGCKGQKRQKGGGGAHELQILA